MLDINREIQQLHQLIVSPPEAVTTGMFCRMYAWGVLSLFNKVNNELETLSGRLDTSIDLDAIGIKFDTYCDINYWTPYWSLPSKRNCSSENHQTAINRMTDYLPNGMEEYLVTPEVLESFKTAMHQLCDEERMSVRALVYALNKGKDTTMQLLMELRKKVENPAPHLYEKLWATLSDKYKYEPAERYQEWKQETGTPTIEDLKAKQKQEIYNLLKAGFFQFANKPTGGEVKKRKMIISEDDLEVGSVIDKDFETECAKFDRYAEWKDNCVLTINYERLGRYIYKNYKQFKEKDFIEILNFDATMDRIHEDMALIRPGLTQYLKRYQGHQDEELLEDCKKIFEPFKEYLKGDIRPTLIDEYLEKLLFDSDVKEEAKTKLRKSSKNKYCCSIVLALSFYNIFKPEFNNNNDDLAKALKNGLGSDNKETLVRYFKDSKNNNKALTQWSSSIIDDLKKTPNPKPTAG